MEREIFYRRLAIQDRALEKPALDLLNRTQGVGLFAPGYIAERLENPESLVLAAFREEELVGIGIVERIRNFDYYHPFDPDIDSELAGRPVASFTTLTVLEFLQGRGIGKSLSKMRLEWAREQGIEVVLGVSWVSGLKHTSNRTFEKTGFRAIKTSADFYRKSSIEKPFDCPGCHRIPCLCGAILFRLDIPILN